MPQDRPSHAGLQEEIQLPQFNRYYRGLRDTPADGRSLALNYQHPDGIVTIQSPVVPSRHIPGPTGKLHRPILIEGPKMIFPP